MNFLRSIRADLIEKRLMPLAVLLVAVAILVPVGFGLRAGAAPDQPARGPAPAATPPPGAPSPATALASIAGPGAPAVRRYTGRELDPFRQGAGAAAPTAAAASGAASSAAVRVTPAGGGAAARNATSGVKPPVSSVKPPTRMPTPVAPGPGPATPTPASTPAPRAQLAQLGTRDSYGLDVSIVDSTGVRGLSNLERLSPLPSSTNPLVEYLGVLKSGRAAAFLVNSRTVAQGPGACLPKATDCQLLVLKPGQVEILGVRTGSGPVVQASVAVSGWRVTPHSSVAAARKVRAQEVKQGRTLVTQSSQPALSALVYTVAQGAVSVIPAVIHALPDPLAKLLGG